MTRRNSAAEFDCVIVGGDEAARLLAHRLSQSRLALSVALIEPGGAEGGGLLRRLRSLGRGLDVESFASVPQPGLNGRVVSQTRDRALSDVAALPRSDCDDWAAQGNPGWSFDGLRPFFLSGRNALPDAADPWQAAWLEGAQQAGLMNEGDPGDADCEGLGVRPRALGAADSVALLGSARLSLQPRTQALRVLFEGRRAVGVEVRRSDGRIDTLRSRGEVLLCAGAYRSAHLLQVSGVGDGAAVQKTGIRFKHHLPGVGRNLQDHLAFSFGYWPAAGALAGWRGPPWARSQPLIECGGFLRLDAAATRPHVQLQFQRGAAVPGRWATHWRAALSLRFHLLRPASRGSVVAVSPDAGDAPLIDPRYFDDPDDMDRMVQAYRLGQRLLQAPALAARLGRDLVTFQVSRPIEIRERMRDLAVSLGHPAGTCRMGPDELAVVDERLRVHGLQGLRVADAAVMPTLAGGDMPAATRLVVEKAAALVLADVG